jgi:phosphatidate cytidylyltransferase
MPKERILSAMVLIPLVLAAVYVGGPVLAAIVALAASGAIWEYARLAQTLGARPPLALMVGFGLLCVADAQWPAAGLWPWASLLLALSLVITVFQGNAPGSLASWAYAVAGALYIGLPISHFVRLRGLEDGLGWLALALLSTWICDTGAYVLGRAIGRHPFFPKISPKKTWEGALGGLISGIAGVMLLGHWLVALDWGWGALLGTLLALAATFGDLAESVIKRQAGAKDSGHLIPGHGGVLDRIDSLLFVVPLVYYFVIVILP